MFLRSFARFPHLFDSIFLGNTARAVAFVAPHVRSAFAAGQARLMKSLLGLIAAKLRETGGLSSIVNSLKVAAGCNDDGQVALQWWVFINTNFSSISKAINIFDAAAQQWDVQGVVYRELFGGSPTGLSGSESSGTKSMLEEAVADAKRPIGASRSAVAYNRNPLRHSFPNVSYNQRNRFSFKRGLSRVSVIR
jgi:hypothetical protein